MALLALCWNSLPKAYLTQPAAMPHVHISTLQGPKWLRIATCLSHT